MRYFVICAIGYVLRMLLLKLAIQIAERELRQLWQ